MRLHSLLRLAASLALVLAFGVSCAGCPGDDDPVETTSRSSDMDNGGFDSGDVDGSDAPVEVAVPELSTVYFDYDQSNIRGDQKDTLRGNAAAIRAGSWNTVVVEGHCDERGSEEYNLALGERRANAVKQYLIDSGVDGARIDTVSFGEARAAAPGHKRIGLGVQPPRRVPRRPIAENALAGGYRWRARLSDRPLATHGLPSAWPRACGSRSSSCAACAARGFCRSVAPVNR